MNIPIKLEQIPPKVVEAMAEADNGTTTYAELLTAALNAWPHGSIDGLNPFGETKYIILPVPMENQ